MSKKIAIITGASSGIGKQFLLQLDAYDQYEEVWVIARNLERLKMLQSQCTFPIKPIALDLSREQALEQFKEFLAAEKPDIKLLINASGWGGFGSVEQIGYQDNLNMIDLNVRALVALTIASLAYMSRGSKVIEIASLAAYQPIPYIATYGASKAFVLNFSRGLNKELKQRGIMVMAVCPYWTKTNFFDRAVKKEHQVVKKYVCMYQPQDVVAQAYRDLKKGKDVSVYGFIAKAQVLLTKLLPHSLVMKVWLKQQELD